MKTYTADEMRQVGYTLEPLKCIECGSLEVTYFQYIDFARCADCGCEQ